MRLRPRYPTACGALAIAAALCGCAKTDMFDNNEHWFSRPFDIAGRNAGYTFSELQESHDKLRPVTANDLVSGTGACPPPPEAAAPASQPAPASASAPGPGSTPAALAPGAGDSRAVPVAPSLLGTMVALNMTECEVVWRVGAPASVQIGSNPNGDRTAQLTFDRGPQAGIYHFTGGRLRAMDRVQASAAAPKASKRVRRERPRSEQISTQ